jgi:8-oxo-dGTP diphosphatase
MEGGVAPEGDRVVAHVTDGGLGTVRAAGGVVWRMGEGGAVEVLLIHRPAYDDWSFPKGKVDPGDVDEEHTALREVEEEAGMRCTLGRELPSSDYIDRKGRPKHVRYWEMRRLSGEFTPNREADESRWLSLPGADALLTYPRDRDILAAFVTWTRAGPSRRAAHSGGNDLAS